MISLKSVQILARFDATGGIVWLHAMRVWSLTAHYKCEPWEGDGETEKVWRFQVQLVLGVVHWEIRRLIRGVFLVGVHVTEIRYWRFQLATIGVTVLSGSLSNSLTHLGGGEEDVDVCWCCWCIVSWHVFKIILLSRHKKSRKHHDVTLSCHSFHVWKSWVFVFEPVVKQPLPWVRDDPNPAGQCLINPLRCCGSWGSDDPDAGGSGTFEELKSANALLRWLTNLVLICFIIYFDFSSPVFVKDMH